MSPDIDFEQEKALITSACESYGFHVEPDHNFPIDEDDDRPYYVIGRGTAAEDDEDEGVFEGDVGELRATCVGSVEYENLQVAWYFKPDGMDMALRVSDPGAVELE